jgi:hypothetical protein
MRLPSSFLFGNTPAADLLNLKDNEGSTYNKDLKLCYAGEKNFVLVKIRNID